MRIKKGDRVVVLQGKDRGKRGEVMRAMPQAGKVIVEGVNISKRASRPKRGMMQGGIIDKDMPLAVSSVAIVCHNCGPTRIGYLQDEQGRKNRVCKKCGGEL
ncbi:MAG: 50S ribosomal protein L24 [Acidimicrobiales bacterium]